ncbi:MAG: hypothetical protein RBU25_09535 [Lentisphaeria bacterium]|jgi:hypothetical protein|nr:hypothetical protein [Lentisphaeria bacterium]
MKTRIAYFVIALGLVSLVSCAKTPEKLDPVALLGATEEQVVGVLGKPQVRGVLREGLQEFMYQDICFNVMLEDGVVTACAIRDASSVSLNEHIRCGVPISHVTEIYGAYVSEVKVEDGMSSEDYLQGVLYHKFLPGGTERYCLRYPDKQLVFTFYPDKTLHSVWIGKIH